MPPGKYGGRCRFLRSRLPSSVAIPPRAWPRIGGGTLLLRPSAVGPPTVCLQELPLTISGKIDRVSLRQGLQAGSDREAPEPSHHVPVATLDERVASAWETVLGQRPQSGADTFIELGGDSLGMMRLIGAYARQGFTVTSRELIESPTVAEQSALLGSGGNDGAAPATPESQ